MAFVEHTIFLVMFRLLNWNWRGTDIELGCRLAGRASDKGGEKASERIEQARTNHRIVSLRPLSGRRARALPFLSVESRVEKARLTHTRAELEAREESEIYLHTNKRVQAAASSSRTRLCAIAPTADARSLLDHCVATARSLFA